MSRLSNASCVADLSTQSSEYVAVPLMVFLAKSIARSSARSVVRTLAGSA